MLLLLVACADDTDVPEVLNTDTSSMLTLDSCEEGYSDEVPAFFQRYFRCVNVGVSGDSVVFSTSNLPPHPSPYYDVESPNYEAFDTRGGSHFQNPNTLSVQAFSVFVPNNPVAKGITVTDDMRDLTADTSDEEYPMGAAGIALDSVALYNAVAAPGDDIREEAYTFDSYEAHPSPDGAYHHHSPNPAGLAVLADLGLTSSTVPGEADVELYGVMCDGTFVLGCTELNGDTPSGDLDAQGGHLGDLVDIDGTTWFTDRYHVHMCSAIDADAFTPEIQYYDTCTVTGVGR